MPEERLLPPFPDDVVRAASVTRAARWLGVLGLPPHVASSHLRRYAEYVGHTLTAAELALVRPRPSSSA